MWTRSAGVSIAILASLMVLHPQLAAGVDAPHGAYLGCFDARGISMPYQVKTVARATLTTCAPSCAQQGYGLAFISVDFKCYCSNTVPTEEAKLKYADCLPGKTGVAAFYLHKDPGSTRCRVSNPPMTRSTWKIAYGRENVEFNPDDNSVAVKLSSPVGARLESKDGMFLYGMYQVEAMISGAPGVVSSFYTRSSSVYPNDIVPDFSEIDWEWCNGAPCEKNTIWLNSLTKAKSHGERKVPPAEYQKLLGTTGRADNTWITYTLNWQPDYVSWSLNGNLLQMSRKGQVVTWNSGGPITRVYESPNLASMQVISVWTDTRPAPSNFGGVADFSAGPFYSYFRNMRRILCDESLPIAPAEAALAMGPAWLYGKNETVSLEVVSEVEKVQEAQKNTTTQSTTKKEYGPAYFEQSWLTDDDPNSPANLMNANNSQITTEQTSSGDLTVSGVLMQCVTVLIATWLALALSLL